MKERGEVGGSSLEESWRVVVSSLISPVESRNIKMLRVRSPPDLDPKSVCPRLSRAGFEGFFFASPQIITIYWRVTVW